MGQGLHRHSPNSSSTSQAQNNHADKSTASANISEFGASSLRARNGAQPGCHHAPKVVITSPSTARAPNFTPA
eukprot:6201294-Pleurochrysis_carterae.AAC.4